MATKYELPLDVRISMYQTCLNNSGQVHQGKRVKASTVIKFAGDLMSHFEKRMNLVPTNPGGAKSTPKKKYLEKVRKALKEQGASTAKEQNAISKKLVGKSLSSLTKTDAQQLLVKLIRKSIKR